MQLLDQVISIAKHNQELVKNQIAILELSKDEQDKVVIKQKEQIAKFKPEWEDIRLKMMTKAQNTSDQIKNRIKENEKGLLEKLYLDVDMSGDPKRWYEKVYPYNLKKYAIELAKSIERESTNLISNDHIKFKSLIYNKFKFKINIGTAEKMNTTDIEASTFDNNLKLNDNEKLKTLAPVATIIAMMVSVTVLGPVAMMGMMVSAAGGLITSNLLKNNTEKQKILIKESIEKEIPKQFEAIFLLINRRIRDLYDKTINETEEIEKLWADEQLEQIHKLKDVDIETQLTTYREMNSEIEKLLLN
jgi:hypothetical protein